MKKLIQLSLVTIIIISELIFLCSYNKISDSETKIRVTNLDNTYIKGISDKVLRFHVIANSDRAEDQRVKLKVRDELLLCYKSSMENCRNKSEAIAYFKKNLKAIEKTSDQVLISNNKSYKSKVYIGDYSFGVKAYGDIVFPPGKYTALKVILGKGKGRNWWCVMFPPLCFIDITTSNATSQGNSELSKVIDKKHLGLITNDSNITKKGSSNKKYEIRFKLADLIDRMFKK